MFLIELIYYRLLKGEKSDIKLLTLLKRIYFSFIGGCFLYLITLYFAVAYGYYDRKNILVFELIMTTLCLTLSFLLSNTEAFKIEPKRQDIKPILALLEVIFIPLLFFSVRNLILS